MPKTHIKIHFQNGLTFESFKKEVFDIEGLSDLYDFEPSAYPDFIVFGPYGNDIPLPGDYTRIGYFCENIKPDFSICEWAFGVPREQDIRHPRYKRIQWHGLDPKLLIKPDNIDVEKILASKTRFCNFFYSHPVTYREKFFRDLSRYKKVDAPGKSMNNMPSVDEFCKGDRWEIKRRFLSEYKFTIAFENDVFPGYQTEKLYDAMLAGSIPVYCGDPFVGDIFNTGSFINAFDILEPDYDIIARYLERKSQMDFIDIRPRMYKGLSHRIARKVKHSGRHLKMKLAFGGLNYEKLIHRIIELDENDNLYKQMLLQPWFNDNKVPANSSSAARWIEIFNKTC